MRRVYCVQLPKLRPTYTHTRRVCACVFASQPATAFVADVVVCVIQTQVVMNETCSGSVDSHTTNVLAMRGGKAELERLNAKQTVLCFLYCFFGRSRFGNAFVIIK